MASPKNEVISSVSGRPRELAITVAAELGKNADAIAALAVAMPDVAAAVDGATVAGVGA